MLIFEKNFDTHQIIVAHTYAAPLQKVWNAFTNPAEMVKWFAPLPYKAVSEKIDFTAGGSWLYYMVSPEGQKHWCIAEYIDIQPLKSYELMDAFCDEKGIINDSFPRTNWKNTFTEHNGTTTVVNMLTYAKVEDMSQIIALGFEEGYKMALNQLEALLTEA